MHMSDLNVLQLGPSVRSMDPQRLELRQIWLGT